MSPFTRATSKPKQRQTLISSTETVRTADHTTAQRLLLNRPRPRRDYGWVTRRLAQRTPRRHGRALPSRPPTRARGADTSRAGGLQGVEVERQGDTDRQARRGHRTPASTYARAITRSRPGDESGPRTEDAAVH